MDVELCGVCVSECFDGLSAASNARSCQPTRKYPLSVARYPNRTEAFDFGDGTEWGPPRTTFLPDRFHMVSPMCRRDLRGGC